MVGAPQSRRRYNQNIQIPVRWNWIETRAVGGAHRRTPPFGAKYQSPRFASERRSDSSSDSWLSSRSYESNGSDDSCATSHGGFARRQRLAWANFVRVAPQSGQLSCRRCLRTSLSSRAAWRCRRSATRRRLSVLRHSVWKRALRLPAMACRTHGRSRAWTGAVSVHELRRRYRFASVSVFPNFRTEWN
jgi:hypothetical protein